MKSDLGGVVKQLIFWRQWEWRKLVDWGVYPEREPLYRFVAIGPIEVRLFTCEPATVLNIELERPNGVNKCLYCGIEITPDNDSGWQGFTETGSQPICKTCDKVEGAKELIKARQ